ncbi:hypothetical protein [Methylophilus sp.]|uniref:hypothetical protein n=1 Tax=Methylophilus sp. TaxID=29541 RepID=UPI00403652C4
MSYPAVISELANAVNSVINVIAWSVLKILPVLVAMLIGLIAIDIVLGPLFDNDVASESPFLSRTDINDLQLTANEQLAPATVTAASQAE